MLELARCCARLCEDSRPVAVFVRIDYSNRVIKRVSIDNQENRPKYFFPESICLILFHFVVIETYL